MKMFSLVLGCLFSTFVFSQEVQKEVVDGIEWTFTISNGTASIGSQSSEQTAIPQGTVGAITIPDTLGGVRVTEIGASAFSGCSSLTSVGIPEGVSIIRRSAFVRCSLLRFLVIPNTVKIIEESAFKDCSSLNSIVIPESVTSISLFVFSGCSALKSVVIPEGITKIGWGMFFNCSSLQSVIIPESVTEIGDEAFADCTSLTLTIPDSVTKIGRAAFRNCYSLTSVVIPKGVTVISENAFYNCNALTSVVIPEGVTTIAKQAFDACGALNSLIMPESLTSLGENALRGCDFVVFNGNVPQGITEAGLFRPLISYPKMYASNWEFVLAKEWGRGTLIDVVTPSRVPVEAYAETPTPKTIKVTYTVKSELPSVKVWAVAWKNGVRSFANIVPIRTGEGVPHGESVATNEEHTFVWDVASDWATDLDKVAVEILVQEGTFLPQELITIPATKTHKAMTITRNALAESWLFNALIWCYAEGDSQLKVDAGRVSVNGVDIAKDNKLPTDEEWDGSFNSYWKREATALLNYLYGKMGYKALEGDNLSYAEAATRLDFADESGNYPLRQVSVKIEEE